MKNSISLLYNICLVIGDFLALIAAFVGAYIMRVSLSDEPFPNQITADTYLAVFLAVLPFWILIFALLGLYNSSFYERRFAEAARLAIGSFIGFLFVLFWDFVSVDPIFPAKLVPVYGLAFAFLFLVLFRTIARGIRTLLYRFNIGITHILIVGNTDIAAELRESLKYTKKSGYRVLGVVGDKRRQNKAEFTTFSEALDAIRNQQFHGIIQTELYADEAKNREILDYAQNNHLSYKFVPGNSELFVGSIDVELFRSSIPVINVHQTALVGWGRVVKRIFDLIIGTVMLLLALPLIIVIYLYMVIFDHGDPIFSQVRLGRYNKKIRIYKFRTQYHAYNRMSPEEGFTKMGRPDLAKEYRRNGDRLPNDPRISRIGRFLQNTSLDELPQIFNVVKGDLSLVGPRPLEPFELDKYGKKNLMLSVKTGLTGLAVVSGRRDIPFEERRKLDLYYVQNWSFWLDIVILFKTIRVVLIDRNGAR